MSESGSIKKRRLMLRLYRMQDERCYWCNCWMAPPGSHRQKRGQHPPQNLCTRDHLDDRNSPERGKHHGEVRSVAACWRCNHDRGKASHGALPLDWRRQMSGRFPSQPSEDAPEDCERAGCAA